MLYNDSDITDIKKLVGFLRLCSLSMRKFLAILSALIAGGLGITLVSSVSQASVYAMN
jgi:hypothetical protein